MSEATGPEKFNNSSKEIKCVRKRKISTTVCGEHEPILCHSNESSEEIVEFYMLVKKGAQKLQQRLHKGSEGNKLFYREFHVSAKDAIDYLKTLDGIKELIY